MIDESEKAVLVEIEGHDLDAILSPGGETLESAAQVLEALLGGTGDTEAGVRAARCVMGALASRLLGRVPRDPAGPHAPQGAIAAALSREVVEGARARCQEDPAMLGPLFEQLVPRQGRYPRGQFFTPPSLAAHMADLVAAHLGSVPAAPVVLDPAAGAGVLLAAAAREIPNARLVGLDLDPLCRDLAEAGLRARRTPAQLETADFLAPPERFDTQPVGQADAVICNPPYVRHHLIERGKKRELAARYSARHQVRVSTLSTSYVYFLLEAVERLRGGGVLVFLTPSDYLDVGFGEALKQVLTRAHHLTTLELFERDDLAFEGVLTTSAITVLRKGAPASSTRLVEAWATPTEVGVRSERTEDLRSVPLSTSWTLQFGRHLSAHQALREGRDHTLADYVKTRRGIATGANRFFVMSQATVDAWGLDEECLTPVVASARDLPDGELTPEHWDALRRAGRRVWLLDCRRPASEFGPGLQAYLEHGRAQGVHERFNCRTRTPWYRMEQVPPPHIIVTYMNRGRTRFVRNLTECRVMSTFLNAWVAPGVDVAKLLEVLNAPETSELVSQMGRTYGGGLGKIEPRELLRLPMPAP